MVCITHFNRVGQKTVQRQDATEMMRSTKMTGVCDPGARRWRSHFDKIFTIVALVLFVGFYHLAENGCTLRQAEHDVERILNRDVFMFSILPSSSSFYGLTIRGRIETSLSLTFLETRKSSLRTITGGGATKSISRYLLVPI